MPHVFEPESNPLNNQHEPIGRVLLLVFHLLLHAVVFSVFLRIPLVHLQCGVDDAENENGRAHIQRPDDRVGDNALRSYIADD